MINLQNITKSFGALQVLKGIDLTIGRGEVVSIVGPSGAGKTTLLQIIGTLDRPDTGRVCFDTPASGRGEPARPVDVTEFSQRRLADFRNRHIGFVFQFHQLLPEFTALENIMIPAYIAGTSPQEARERAKELLAFMGLSDRASHKPSELSGGEKQRISIARVLLKNPALLIFDEATSMLDPAGAKEVIDTINGLYGKKTIISITHNLNEAVSSDRVIVLNKGKIVLDGKPSEVFKETEILKECNLDITESMKLLELVKKSDIKNKQEVEDLLWELTFKM